MDPAWLDQFRSNAARVRARIAAACARAGRDPASVRLVTVTKSAPPELLPHLPALGATDLAENRVQALLARAELCGPPQLGWPSPGEVGPARPRWHMIGHLQRNKVKAVLSWARIIHSLDSTRLADAIEQHAVELDVVVDVLIELNLAGEQSKTGVPAGEFETLVRHTRACPHLRLRGLMTMAPYDPDPQRARPIFAALRRRLDDLRTSGCPPECRQLSMGMSQDYEVAIEEGATLIRIGSALFDGIR